eukprot:1182156-Prorocentrum_minimum.AAC.1
MAYSWDAKALLVSLKLGIPQVYFLEYRHRSCHHFRAIVSMLTFCARNRRSRWNTSCVEVRSGAR